MKVSCAVPRESASAGLVKKLNALGIRPTTTPFVIRAVYEGERRVGERVVDLFASERDADIYFSYDKNEQTKAARREIRKEAKKRR